jgi:RNA polymerase sigma factor (sigma-70 family)
MYAVPLLAVRSAPMENSTCWLLIEGAAAGRPGEREDFARRYEPVIRSYLGARWRNGPRAADLDDAVQEVFLECFRAGGVLARVDPARPGGFRAFLYGVARNVALRCERRAAGRRERPAGGGGEDGPPAGADLEAVAADDGSLSRAFDRAWTETLLREAARLQEERARRAGEDALRRVELLRLRFQEDLPIREIARRWGTEADRLHKEYARARQEFKEALLETVAFHRPGSLRDVERECAELLALLRDDG